jgi:hypothetical protein
LIKKAAIEGNIVQQNTTESGELYKVDWVISDQDSIILRTLWELTLDSQAPRLISAFIR